MSLFFIPVLVGAFLSFLCHRRHLLFSLLSLEAMMLGLIISLSTLSSAMRCNYTLIIVFVFAVAEARLGLSVLVSMTRYSDRRFVAR